MTSPLASLVAACGLSACLAWSHSTAALTVDEQVQKDLHFHIAELAQDAYAGREPGTPGEEMTIDWLVRHFAELGVTAGCRRSPSPQ